MDVESGYGTKMSGSTADLKVVCGIDFYQAPNIWACSTHFRPPSSQDDLYKLFPDTSHALLDVAIRQ